MSNKKQYKLKGPKSSNIIPEIQIFGENLKQIRQDCKLSIEEAGYITNVEKSRLSNYEHAKIQMRMGTFFHIMDAYLNYAIENEIPIPETLTCCYKIFHKTGETPH